ncbi:MAG: phosphomannomutase/phosphoglucomutase [bacterium]|nr:phosphomannomutase/phosphoglucomutase [bacterium]
MEFNTNIFKAYDIRGILKESEITNQLAYHLGKAVATFLKNETGKEQIVVTVGRDMRETSPVLQVELMRGLTELGAHVRDIGLVSTPTFYYGVGETNADGGVMVSASHNPAEYNGFKLTRASAVPISGDTGIRELADLIVREDYDAPAAEPGTIETIEGISARAAKMQLEYVGAFDVPKLKIAADSSNGMGAEYLDEVFRQLGLEDVYRLFWEFDGTFPNHHADPLKAENRVDIEAHVKEIGADLGIVTDGDGDRIFFVDNTGKTIDPAIVRGILAEEVLKDHPGAKIGRDIRPGRVTDDMIKEAGGTPVMTRVGHSLIKEQMRKEDLAFAGESSGHFYYRFQDGIYDGPVAAIAQMLKKISEAGKPVAEIIAPYYRYAHSGEINFEVEDKQAAMDKVREKFADGELSELDGITITFEDFWFNVRPSNTEPVLRLNLEAVDEATMQTRRDEVAVVIQS